MLSEVLLLAALFCGGIYLWIQNRYKYFEKRGIEHRKPHFLVGNFKDVFAGKIGFFDAAESFYKIGKSG